jgi:hypothetical protein
MEEATMRRHAALMSTVLILAGLTVGASVAQPIPESAGATATPKFIDSPVFGVPFLESNAVSQGQRAVLGFEIGCYQNMISPNIHAFAVNGAVVNVTVNVTITPQCFMPTRIFRYAFGGDLPPGVYEVRLFARYGGTVVARGTIPLQVLVAEPVPALQPRPLLLLLAVMLLIGLWSIRLRV